MEPVLGKGGYVMHRENCKAPGIAGLFLLAPMVALIGAVMGRCAGAKHHLGAPGDGPEVGCRHHGHHGCGGGRGRGFRGGHGHDHDHGHAPGARRRGFDPMRILDKRFANGEIDEDEYQRRRNVLKDKDSA